MPDSNDPISKAFENLQVSLELQTSSVKDISEQLQAVVRDLIAEVEKIPDIEARNRILRIVNSTAVEVLKKHGSEFTAFLAQMPSDVARIESAVLHEIRKITQRLDDRDSSGDDWKKGDPS